MKTTSSCVLNSTAILDGIRSRESEILFEFQVKSRFVALPQKWNCGSKHVSWKASADILKQWNRLNSSRAGRWHVMVAVLPIAPMMRIAKPGSQPCGPGVLCRRTPRSA